MDTSELEELLSPTKEFLLTYFLPEKCYNYFFVDLNFLHVPCWKIVLSKTVGVWIILGTVMAQLPQLWKVLRARSASGISWWSVLLQVYAITGPVVYCITNNVPLEVWPWASSSNTTVVTPSKVIPAMQASSMLAVVASRVIQAGTNYYHGNTGQLSALSVFLVFTGSLALIFTSLQETGDWSSVSTVTHVVAACLSCLLLTQVVCYRNSRTKDKTE
ncbi:mannose-P-dolichol utilization defect 1 protein isoform X3 [Salvelinus sp. IW2-2015]|uniref:mannose-P-dolichol utilization defect 1 protein isoform X3 n=1 Tax=Salvelinus sp. IW2-2015 TaxID=2691554 RepID=UPI000CDF7994|nr:mannose-P-dolichol utilization defect 1 protein isoform X3 [Salvelinus alpinus]